MHIRSFSYSKQRLFIVQRDRRQQEKGHIKVQEVEFKEVIRYHYQSQVQGERDFLIIRTTGFLITLLHGLVTF